MDFTKFYETLTSEEVWFESCKMTYRNKDYKQVARECYTWLLSQPNRWKLQDYSNFRVAYQRFLFNAPEKVDLVVRNVAEPVVIHPQALTGEERERRLKEWQDTINKTPIDKPIPKMSYAELAEIGGVRRPKDKPYPSTTEEELKAKELHREYILYCYEPMTGLPNEKWIEEKEFIMLRKNELI